MPLINATLAWAVPVQIEILGAHLEAYANLQEDFISLRLCHRFGREATITRLPVELIERVEDFLSIMERDETMVQWQREARCAEDDCGPEDHHNVYDGEQLRQFIQDSGVGHGLVGDAFVNEIDEAIEYSMDPPWWEVHEERQVAWRDRINRRDGFFTKHLALMRSNFGLAIWTTPVRLLWPGMVMEVQSEVVALAYLTLPGNTSSDRDFAEVPLDMEHIVESGCAIQVNRLPSKPDSYLFLHAMRILDLSPKSHETQQRQPLYVAGGDKSLDKLRPPPRHTSSTKTLPSTASSFTALTEFRRKTFGRRPVGSAPKPEILAALNGDNVIEDIADKDIKHDTKSTRSADFQSAGSQNLLHEEPPDLVGFKSVPKLTLLINTTY